MSDAHPEFAELAGYWLGELSEDRAQGLEAHFFGCEECTRRLEFVAGLAAGIRDAMRSGSLVRTAVSRAFLEEMKNARMRVREYRVAPGGSVQCTIRADDDALVSRLQAPLAGVRRLDALEWVEGGAPRRLEDIPFDPESGEVLLCPSAAVLRALPATTLRVRLLAVDEAGERPLGDYTFVHTPS